MTQFKLPVPNEEMPDLLALKNALQNRHKFGIYFARVNEEITRRDMLAWLRGIFGDTLLHIELSGEMPIVKQILEKIRLYKNPSVISVSGLDRLRVEENPQREIQAPNRLYHQLNWERQQFKQIEYPILFWVSEATLREIARFAPDFFDWHSGVYEFSVPEGNLQQTYDRFVSLSSEPLLANSEKERNEQIVALTSLLEEYESQKRDPVARANVLRMLGRLHYESGYRLRALPYYEKSLMLYKEIGDKLGEANVLKAIGDVQQFRDERDAALESYQKALGLYSEIGAKLGEANVYISLGSAKRESKNYSGSRTDFENALKIYQTIGDQYSQARALYRLGDCFSDEEKYKDALAQYEKAAQLWLAIGVNDLVENILKPRIEKAKKHL